MPEITGHAVPTHIITSLGLVMNMPEETTHHEMRRRLRGVNHDRHGNGPVDAPDRVVFGDHPAHRLGDQEVEA